MVDPNSVIEIIRAAFDPDEHPGDRWLQGTFEGEEPYDEIGAFKGHHDWRVLEPAFLDQHYTALSFFSEGGFRYYIPAYIVADLRHELLTADPVFHLTHGFVDFSTTMDVGDRDVYPFERADTADQSDPVRCADVPRLRPAPPVGVLSGGSDGDSHLPRVRARGAVARVQPRRDRGGDRRLLAGSRQRCARPRRAAAAPGRGAGVQRRAPQAARELNEVSESRGFG